MPRGRPRKVLKTNIISQEKSKMEEALANVHVVIRFISKLNRSNPMTGEISGADFDALLDKWYTMGYRVAQAMYIGDAPEGHGIMVVLQKEL